MAIGTLLPPIVHTECNHQGWSSPTVLVRETHQDEGARTARTDSWIWPQYEGNKSVSIKLCCAGRNRALTLSKRSTPFDTHEGILVFDELYRTSLGVQNLDDGNEPPVLPFLDHRRNPQLEGSGLVEALIRYLIAICTTWSLYLYPRSLPVYRFDVP